MKKNVVILIAVTILFAACNSNSPSAAKHDFRDVDFGMSTIELFEIEGEPDDEFVYGDYANYSYENKEAFGLKNVEIEYSVYDYGIGYATATFKNEYADNKSYIAEYNTVKKNLISAWGEPASISEDEDEFKFSCAWENKFLSLNRNSEGNAYFQVNAFSSEYWEAIRKEKQTSDTE